MVSFFMYGVQCFDQLISLLYLFLSFQKKIKINSDKMNEIIMND